MSRLRRVAWLGLLLPLTGCGYTAGGPFRTGIRSVYVEMFESKEFRRDLEFLLLEAVKKRISIETPYRLAPREKADTILTAEVLEERQAAFAPDYQTRYPREKQLNLSIRVQWKDLRTGRILFDVPRLEQAADYLPAPGETEKFAQQKVSDRLASRIVSRMYEEW